MSTFITVITRMYELSQIDAINYNPSNSKSVDFTLDSVPYQTIAAIH